MCEVHWKWTDMTDKSGGDGYNPGYKQITHNKSRREDIGYDMIIGGGNLKYTPCVACMYTT